METNHTIKDTLDYWYSEPVTKRWFNSTPAFDNQLKSTYETLWQSAANSELDHWKNSAEGCLALCVILDQFPLNMYRNEAISFSTESKAIEITKHAVDLGLDQQLQAKQCAFLYMPLMHSENLEDQNLAVSLFTNARLEGNIRFAKHHRDIIERFGRFPHRNAILGRTSTEEEISYLQSKEAFTG